MCDVLHSNVWKNKIVTENWIQWIQKPIIYFQLLHVFDLLTQDMDMSDATQQSEMHLFYWHGYMVAPSMDHACRDWLSQRLWGLLFISDPLLTMDSSPTLLSYPTKPWHLCWNMWRDALWVCKAWVGCPGDWYICAWNKMILAPLQNNWLM